MAREIPIPGLMTAVNNASRRSGTRAWAQSVGVIVKRSHSGSTAASSGMTVALSINRCQSSCGDLADIEELMAVTSSSVILFRGDLSDAMYVSYLWLPSRVKKVEASLQLGRTRTYALLRSGEIPVVRAVEPFAFPGLR